MRLRASALIVLFLGVLLLATVFAMDDWVPFLVAAQRLRCASAMRARAEALSWRLPPGLGSLSLSTATKVTLAPAIRAFSSLIFSVSLDRSCSRPINAY